MHRQSAKVPTEDIPQANSLRSLRAVVQAISAGAVTTAEIEGPAHLKPRHVRYYMLAAQTLGWLKLEPRRPLVTVAGEELLLTTNGSLEESDAIAAAIVKSTVLQAAVAPFLDDATVDEGLVAERLLASTRLSPATAKRRAACLMAWRTQLLDRGWMPGRLTPVAARLTALLPISALSVRARGVLVRLGVEGPEDLARLSREALQRTRNCGWKTTKEILSWTRVHGLPLKGETQGDVGTIAVPRQHLSIESVKDLPLELLLELSSLSLSARTRRRLEGQGIERLGDLVSISEATLRSRKNYGRKTIDELNAVVGSLGLSLGMRIPLWSTVDVDELARRHASGLARIRRRLQRRLYALDSSRGVESEIGSALAAVVAASARPKVELWIGLDRDSLRTLQEVADVADLTRERIRQIVERTQHNLHALQLDFSRLRGAVACLERARLLSDRAAKQLLIEQGYAEGSVSMRGLLRAAELFGISTRLRCERLGDQGFVGLAKDLAALKFVQRAGRRAVERWGCSTLEDVAAEVADKLTPAVTPDLVKHVLMTQDGFRWLDEESGWFWLRDVPRNRLLNKIDKILAAASRVDLSTLRAGVARHYRMEGFSPPTRVLRAVCEQLEDCEVVGGQIVVDRRPRRPADQLSPHEQTTLEVFRKYGPVLSYAEARQRCIDAGLNEITTTIYLSNSPIVRRVATGLYTIIGAEVSPGEIDAAARTVKKARQDRVIQDYGWSADGKSVWASYKVSEGMLRSGVVGVPGGIKKYLSEDGYDLRGLEGTKIGRIGVGGGSMWGFSPYFRRRGGEAGDYMKVSFNLSDKTALAELSEETFEDET